MKVAHITLCLYGCFLHLRFSLACHWSFQCPYRAQSCCKKTETGTMLAEGLCVFGTCGDGVCRTKHDCSPNKRCVTTPRDKLRFRCTTVCCTDYDCREMYGENSGYICSYNEVIKQDQSLFEENSDSTQSTIDMPDSNTGFGTGRIMFISFGIIVFCMIVCCLCNWIKRREMATRNAPSTGRFNALERGNVTISLVEIPVAMQTTSIYRQSEHPNGLTPDAIAVSGPPVYMEVKGVPECPPPTYEEATRARTEN